MNLNPTKEDFDLAYYKTIWKIVSEINQQENKKLKKELENTLKVILQKYTGFPTSMVSHQVFNLIEKKKIEINPFEIKWSQRHILGKFENGKKNNIMWEHVETLSESVLNLKSCSRELEVLKYLKNYPGLCLITREEDNRLNKKYKTKRPGGWEKCYEECGIKYITRNEYYN